MRGRSASPSLPHSSQVLKEPSRRKIYNTQNRRTTRAPAHQHPPLCPARRHNITNLGTHSHHPKPPRGPNKHTKPTSPSLSPRVPPRRSTLPLPRHPKGDAQRNPRAYASIPSTIACARTTENAAVATRGAREHSHVAPGRDGNACVALIGGWECGNRGVQVAVLVVRCLVRVVGRCCCTDGGRARSLSAVG